MGTGPRRLGTLAVCCCALAGCASPSTSAPSTPNPPTDGAVFRAADCNGITDHDVTAAVGTTLFTRVVVNDAGCFWQENTAIADYGLGMGISTWWYRGSDLDTERSLEQKADRTLTERSVNGNKGFKAYDGNACSIYVAKRGDVITWSVQTVNRGMLPGLCSITGRLAQLSQHRVN